MIARVIADLRAEWREGGFRAVLGYVNRRLFSRSQMWLYEGSAGAPELPERTRIVAIPPAAVSEYGDALRQAGVGSDIRNADRGAVCYLLLDGEESAALGWLFPNSRLLRRLGYPRNAVYLGGFVTRSEYRGRGYYPSLLRHISHSVGNGRICVVETSPTNLASQRGLDKAGFLLVGTVRRVVVAGVMIRCSLEGV